MSETIDEKDLVKFLLKHRRCRAANFGSGRYGYVCLCGEELPSNSHHALAKHQAEKLIEKLQGTISH